MSGLLLPCTLTDEKGGRIVPARGKVFFGFFTESWGETNKGLGEAPKSYTRKEHESATNSIAKRGQGAIAPCRVKGQRPLWGLGQRPNCSAGDQYAKRAQQRCRQRSVPASNSALPQERPRTALPPRFREEPIKMRWNAIFSASSAFCFLYFFPSSSSFCSSCMNVPISVKRRYTAAKRTYATSFVAFSSSITMSPMRWEEISPSMLA